MIARQKESSDILNSLTSVQQWNAIAPYWRCLENRGLGEQHLCKFASQLKSPVLVVGAGQGYVMADLQRRGFVVRGIDFSSTMARLAKERRGCEISVANAQHLPFDAESFGSVMVATGVLRPDSPAASFAILRECARVGIDGAQTVVTCLVTSESAVATIAALGLAKGRTYDVSRIHRLWLEKGERSRQAEMIAEWTGLGNAAASKRVSDRRLLVDALLRYHDRFVSCLTSCGGNVDATIEALANLDAQPFIETEIGGLLQDVPLIVLEEAIDFDAGVFIAFTKSTVFA